eukprot:CAMPEP_0171797926 /NCGR_PEP_ID=MMETSP0991-20121206/70257_1 /TAXON_ID=483369 /ORGANISM="non described non described, Strain CCMP2098" /LENGTH=67 /DNA_ID=CAMNT_0012409103 /DNA_START=9 /DNA_END=209 /DNA_ORIENTATION=-
MSGVMVRANQYSRRDEKAFYKSVVKSLLKNQVDYQGKKKNPSDAAALASPATLKLKSLELELTQTRM